MSLKYQIKSEAEVSIITLSGKMIGQYYALFEECLVQTSMITEKYVVIDMSEVVAIDPIGLEIFEKMWLTLARTDVELRVCGIHSKIKPYFSMILVDDEIKEDIAECLGSFGIGKAS